jgi:hypothetical protein
MRRRNAHVDPDLDALIARGRLIEPVHAVVRARALDRARAMSSAAGAPRQIRAPRRRWMSIALAASFVLAAIAASAIAALRGFGSYAAAPLSRFSGATAVKVPAIDPLSAVETNLPPSESPSALPSTAPTVAPLYPPPNRHRFARPGTPRELYAAEIELLARAQAAYVAGAFADALSLATDHARRFPNGKLAEEREALRVKSLDGAGRIEEARRAADAFADRFPRSVMLPRLGKAQ